ncbi:hypothetical protein KQI69_00430 [Eubacterium sp. MSJ-13]|uniref:hypothetical protein n=1 Tax=Eubacterium sp. MSJ-13 TaxID=2841513 RepID=UPI001C119F91|nr:hypothetical protein [Eubacterium sp. MSJ-13]MBU5477666.1 hypothetical protein [Eubacterium sp. MSJ-13]
MKIYNKSSFVEGFFCTILGLVLLFTIFITSFNIKKLILSSLVLFIGIGLLQRSISKAMSLEDKTDKLDERNQFISVKSKGKSLQITQIISWILMLILLIVGKVGDNILIVSVGTGIMIPFTVSLFVELFCMIYYEIKN